VLKWIVVVAAIWIAWRLLGPGRPVKAAPVADEARARAVLGVSAGADATAIRAAHRRLVGAVHPDRGGSAELTRELNAARDTLLGRRG
jgi:hypothetical protein